MLIHVTQGFKQLVFHHTDVCKNPVAEKFFPDFPPKVFYRIELGTVWRKKQNRRMMPLNILDKVLIYRDDG